MDFFLLITILVKTYVVSIVKNCVKKSATDVIKTASKRAVHKTAEATEDLTDNKNADKITSVSKKSSTELPSNEANNEIPKERYISRQERQQNIDE